jgi:Dolichyl-phosphate-mannose-protein mannosyltransferase
MGTPALDEEAESGVAADAPAPASGPGFVRAWLPAGVLVAVAAALSLPRIGVRTLWLDEAYTVGATSELLDTWRHTGVTQALYYALVWPVTRLSTDPAWIRLPSALLGLAAVAVVFRVGRRLGGERVALLGAGGLALSWGLARYSVEARSYTLALLLVSTSWLALIAALQSGDESDGGDASRRWWRIFYVATALTPLAHGLAALNFVAQLGALAIAPADRRALVRRALLVAPVLAIELVAMFSLGAGEVGDWVPPLGMWHVDTFRRLLLGFGAAGLVIGALLALAIGDVVRRYVRERSVQAWIQVLPVFWALGPTALLVLMSLIRPYAAARYVIPSLPAFFLLIAGLLVRYLDSARRIALAAVLLAPLLLVDQRHVTTDGIEDWSELTACIAANSVPGDRLVTAASHRSALDYYWSDHPELSSVEPLSPPEPLGQIRRLYESRTKSYSALLSVFFEDTSRSIWFVDRLARGRHGVLGLAFDEDVTARFDVIDPWYFEGELTLARLDPVGSDRPRSTGSCDTVPTPADMRPPTSTG